MGRLLRVLAPGVCGAGVAVAAWSVWWLANDVSRNKVSRPIPIVPICDGTPITRTGPVWSVG